MSFFADWFYKIREWFRSQSERNQLITDFNENSRHAFISGQVPTYLRAKTSRGDKSYRHQYTQFFSGFRITVMGGSALSRTELSEVGKVILSNEQLVRGLVVNGFDTLEVHGENDSMGMKWRLQDFLMLT